MYQKFNWLSIFSIFMLFVLGGLVRSTGSGMGCPDWPKCFGEYIPPTSADQLPADYKEFFTELRLKKTDRFVNLLRSIGLEEKANEISESPQLTESHEYNTAKAYIEYVNRLWGAATGIVVLLCLVFALPLIRTHTAVFMYTLLGFVMVMVNGLLGAVVVNSNLLSGIVTAHFLAAFAAIGFFLIARSKWTKADSAEVSHKLRYLSLFTLIVILLQIVFGTQLREVYEQVINTSPDIRQSVQFPRGILGLSFDYHLYGSFATLIVILIQMVQLFSYENWAKWGILLSVLIGAQILFGSLIIYNVIEPISKLFHISIGAGIFVVQFYICTRIWKRDKSLSVT